MYDSSFNLELMMEVRARVLEDYKKVNMHEYLQTITKESIKRMEDDIKCGYSEPEESLKAMSCGTAGCIAGHALLASLKPKQIKSYISSGKVFGVAQNLLGLSKLEAEMLFMFHTGEAHTVYDDDFNVLGTADSDVYRDEYEALKGLKAGTKAYAKVCVRAIDKCIARNT